MGLRLRQGHSAPSTPMNDAPAPTAAKPVRDDNRHGPKLPTDRTIPCYVIGLADVPERWQSTIAIMQELGLEVRLWPAVDGRHGRPALLPGERAASRFRLWFLKLSPMADRELGCFLSHYRLLLHCYNAGYPRFAIFEDDILPHSHLPRALEAVAGLDESYGIVYLNPQTAQPYIQKLAEQARHSDTSDNEMMLWPAALDRNLQDRDNLYRADSIVFHRGIVATLLARLMPIYIAYDIQLVGYSGIRPWVSLLDPPATTLRDAGSTIDTDSPNSRGHAITVWLPVWKWIRQWVRNLLRSCYYALNRYWQSRLRRQLGARPPAKPLGPIHPHE